MDDHLHMLNEPQSRTRESRTRQTETRRKRFAAAVLAVTLTALGTAAWQPVAAAETADTVTNADQPVDLAGIALRDEFDRQHVLVEVKQPILVLAFLGVECPLAKLYTTRLRELHGTFDNSQVRLIAVDSNTQDTPQEIAAFGRQHQLSFPMLKDPGNGLADRVRATRTPEVVVLDAQRRIRYRGRIDDQYGISIQREAPTREDLAEAVRELSEGKPVSVPRTELVGCLIGRQRTVAPTGDITYSRHIAEIFNRRCVECHRRSEIAPFPLQTYQDTVGWGPTIAEVIEQERMPPWNANPKHGVFSNDARLSSTERKLVLEWIANGSPEGDPADLPETPSFSDGWRIPEPDQVIPMRDQPFDIPAEGVVPYQYYVVKPDFEQDRFVSAVEARPGNRSVVHHIIVYIRQPGQRRAGLGSMLIGYAPGGVPTELPEGWAYRIPAGTELLFELHYTPNGSPQQDRSDVGLKFIDEQQVTHLVRSEAILNRKFKIPADDPHYEVTAEKTLGAPVEVVSMSPHMHVRGKAFRYEVFYPDGRHDILLDVPRYDFNWQLTYKLQDRLRLPRGTRVVCSAVFDNSADNPNNPDPSKVVEWGQQSWEEMMIGFFGVVTPYQPNR